MSSTRPLVTITIILVAGAYLFVKINEGPVAPLPETADAWQSEADVPPLASTVGAASSTDGTAPAWPPASNATALGESVAATFESDPSALPTVDVAASSEPQPTVPAIPELPDMPAATTVASTEQRQQFGAVPDALPQNIPVASYPDEPASTAQSNSNDPYGTMPDAAPAAAAQSPATDTPISATTPPATNQVPPTVDSTSPGAPLANNPLREATPPTAVLDPYAPIASTSDATSPVPTTPGPTTPAAATPTTSAQSSFAAIWPEIQTALQRGELAHAHKRLSTWYNDSSLTPAEAETVEKLLSQLAGTVVYSTQHQLEPARVVRPGETLETIAQQYNVPWQLLAKINGIAAVDSVQPGQQIKVVPGPFSAVVDLRRSQLTLMVGGRYAGKFPVKVTDTAALKEGEWVVQGKPATTYQPASTASARQLVLTEATATPAAPTTPLVIGSQPSSQPTRERIGADGQITTTAIPYVAVSPGDAEELADILSVGSRVTIRR